MLPHLLAIVFIILAASPSFADCVINGTCTGAPSDVPALGSWRYELTMSWDNTRHGMSHLDLIIDDGLNCSDADLQSGLTFPAAAGHGDGEDGCPLVYEADFSPHGDPSLGLTVPMFKFEPDESEGCEAGPTGSATFVFYSDYAPYPVAEHNLALVEKYAGYMCVGNLSGEFPALPCAPVGNTETNWSTIKAEYSR